MRQKGVISSLNEMSINKFMSQNMFFPFLDGDVPRRPSYGVYLSQLIRFVLVCSRVDDFNTHNKCLTAKLLKWYHKLRKAFQSSIADAINLFRNSMSD